MTWALAPEGPVSASDANARLIGLYQAVRAGWRPPEEVQSAPDEPGTLADYCHFCLGFGGIPGAGIQKPFREAIVRSGPEIGKVKRMWPHRATAERIVREALAPTSVRYIDFLSVQPQQTGAVLYLDPPYAGTVGYEGVFNSDRFFERAEAWAKFGPVFISEYACPIGREVWARDMKTGQFARGKRTERLFLIGA